jgi:LmbE family N-acetylglucosaminyl deacetylase
MKTIAPANGVTLMKRFLVLLFPAFILLSASMAKSAASEIKSTQVALYVFAHEDDELDVGAKIVTDMRDGKEVYCAWVTDGSRGGAAADVREKESRAVMDFLHVPPDHLFFLGFPDQGAYTHLKEIIAALDKIAAGIKPTEIMSHAFEGGNIDHDSVSFVSSAIAKKYGIVHYEFPDSNVYKGKTQIFVFLPDGKSPTLYTPLDDALYSRKMHLLKMYPSQQGSMSSYEWSVDKKHLKKFGEPYRVAPDYDYTKPPADELRYTATSKGLRTFADWQLVMKDFYPATQK